MIVRPRSSAHPPRSRTTRPPDAAPPRRVVGRLLRAQQHQQLHPAGRAGAAGLQRAQPRVRRRPRPRAAPLPEHALPEPAARRQGGGQPDAAARREPVAKVRGGEGAARRAAAPGLARARALRCRLHRPRRPHRLAHRLLRRLQPGAPRPRPPRARAAPRPAQRARCPSGPDRQPTPAPQMYGRDCETDFIATHLYTCNPQYLQWCVQALVGYTLPCSTLHLS